MIRLFLIFITISFLVLPATVSSSQDQEGDSITDTVQRNDVRYRLFPTDNIWTHLLLDTRTGRVWQVHFNVSDDGVSGTISVNYNSLIKANDPPNDGRFTLYPTKNMYNFLLLDQNDGRIWQIQWSFNENNRGIVSRLPSLDNK